MLIRELRKQCGLTMRELGEKIGVSESTISLYETGKREPNYETLLKMAELFNVSVDYLLRGDATPMERTPPAVPPGFEPLPRMVKKPLVGSIACGEPITAEQNIEGYVDVPEGMHCDFCLRCKGDSMIDAGIHDGDVVYIYIQPEVENGQIAAVRIDGEATLKRVFWDAEHQTLTLLAENRTFPPLVYTGPALETIHIEGKAVGWTHWV